jgi:hypothetical protein
MTNTIKELQSNLEYIIVNNYSKYSTSTIYTFNQLHNTNEYNKNGYLLYKEIISMKDNNEHELNNYKLKNSKIDQKYKNYQNSTYYNEKLDKEGMIINKLNRRDSFILPLSKLVEILKRNLSDESYQLFLKHYFIKDKYSNSQLYKSFYVYICIKIKPFTNATYTYILNIEFLFYLYQFDKNYNENYLSTYKNQKSHPLCKYYRFKNSELRYNFKQLNEHFHYLIEKTREHLFNESYMNEPIIDKFKIKKSLELFQINYLKNVKTVCD